MAKKSSQHLTLFSAVMININIMLSIGLFINTAPLSYKVKSLSYLLYPLLGLFMFPLMYVIAALLRNYPEQSFYGFAAPLSPFLGFFSCWSFVWGKLASGALMLFVGVSFLQKTIFFFQQFSTLKICFSLIVIFIFLNYFDISLGLIVQRFFLMTKIIPIVTLLVISIVLWNANAYEAFSFSNCAQLPFSIPLVLYCLAGFESACSISRTIKNPSVNGPRAIFISFGIILALYTVFQYFMYGALQPFLSEQFSYISIIPTLFSSLFSSSLLYKKCMTILYCMISCAAFGGAYGIFFSNIWNFVTLAEQKHLLGSAFLQKKNRYGIPFFIVLCQGIIYSLYIFLSSGNQIILQYIASFGLTIAYFISAIAFYIQQSKSSFFHRMIAFLACLTCFVFIISCISSLMMHTILFFVLFVAIECFGVLNFFYTHSNVKKT